MNIPRTNCVIIVTAFLFTGCTHHAVRVEATKDPDNRLIIREEVRAWPATMHDTITITLPPGDYRYNPADYDRQTNLPEQPVRTLKYSEIKVFIRGSQEVKEIDGGWIAVFRDGVELQLLWSGSPASINGRSSTKVPFILPLP